MKHISDLWPPNHRLNRNKRLKTGACSVIEADLHKPMCYEFCSGSSHSLGWTRLPSWPLNGSHTETNLMRKVFERDLPEQNKLSVAKERRDREGRKEGWKDKGWVLFHKYCILPKWPWRSGEETERPDSTVEAFLLLQTPIIWSATRSLHFHRFIFIMNKQTN